MSAMTLCPEDSDLMKAWKAYQATDDFKNTSFWATTSLKTRPERAAEIGLDPTANIATDEDRKRNVQGTLWAAFMAGFAASGGDGGTSFPRFLSSSSENSNPRVVRCVFAADLSNEDHRKIATALIFKAVGEIHHSDDVGSPVGDNPDDPTALRLQQGLATPNTTSTDTISSRRNRDVGNVAKPEECSASAPHVPPASSEAFMATPPVRGDREAIAKIIHEQVLWKDRDRGNLERILLEAADAILSLPVQPGAGDREVTQYKPHCGTPDSIYSIKIAPAWIEISVSFPRENRISITEQQAVELEIQLHDAVEAVMAKHFTLSRQAPHSSSEGGR